MFRNRDLHFVHFNINCLLLKIKKLCHIAKSTNTAIIDISASELDVTVLEPGISIENYKILDCDRNRHSGGVACYVKNNSIYNPLSVFPCDVENIFFEILLPNSKPIIVETTHCPTGQSTFFEVINNMDKID